MNIAFFGSSLLSAYWNGAATYYRGIIRALHARGHHITFYEPDAYDRQQHRDIEPPEWAEVVVYQNSESAVMEQIEAARGADLIVKASGVGVFDSLLEEAVLDLKHPGNLVAFWDVDAPATLDRVNADRNDHFRPLIPRYDMIFTYGGGDPVVRSYTALGARACIPVYNGLDSETHHPVPPDERFACTLAFLGNRLPDREARVDEFFFGAAKALPQHEFILAGNGWQDRPVPSNVKVLGHLGTKDHNAFNCTPLAILNISRASMARYGYSPATRVFEAAGAAACIISDDWEGIETFFEPDYEILVAQDGDEVAELLDIVGPKRAREIGEAAYRRVIKDHTYAQRAVTVEAALEGAVRAVAVA
jgi:spore maturation protein CgeB